MELWQSLGLLSIFNTCCWCVLHGNQIYYHEQIQYTINNKPHTLNRAIYHTKVPLTGNRPNASSTTDQMHYVNRPLQHQKNWLKLRATKLKRSPNSHILLKWHTFFFYTPNLFPVSWIARGGQFPFTHKEGNGISRLEGMRTKQGRKPNQEREWQGWGWGIRDGGRNVKGP